MYRKRKNQLFSVFNENSSYRERHLVTLTGVLYTYPLQKKLRLLLHMRAHVGLFFAISVIVISMPITLKNNQLLLEENVRFQNLV